MNKDTISKAYLNMILNEMTDMYGDDDIPKDDTHKHMLNFITSSINKPIKISDTHYKLPYNSKTIVSYHKTNNDIHSISMFEQMSSPNKYQHVIASKGNANDASGIYKNIQDMIDSGNAVYSDGAQTRGGRKLWINMHNHVNFNKAYKTHMDTDESHEVKDFSDLSSDKPDPYVYSISK